MQYRMRNVCLSGRLLTTKFQAHLTCCDMQLQSCECRGMQQLDHPKTAAAGLSFDCTIT